MIQVSHLEKSFEGFRALKGVDMPLCLPNSYLVSTRIRPRSAAI